MRPIRAAIGAATVDPALLTAAEDTKPYECDGLTLFRELPVAVVQTLMAAATEAPPDFPAGASPSMPARDNGTALKLTYFDDCGAFVRPPLAVTFTTLPSSDPDPVVVLITRPPVHR